MADFLVLYEYGTGVVDALWPAGAANNLATWEADGHIEIDGVIVAGIEAGGAYTPAVAIITDPTFVDTAAPPGVAIVDAVLAPAEITERTTGDRFPDYPYSP